MVHHYTNVLRTVTVKVYDCVQGEARTMAEVTAHSCRKAPNVCYLCTRSPYVDPLNSSVYEKEINRTRCALLVKSILK